MENKNRDFVPPATKDEAYSRKEQFLDNGVEQFMMDELEGQIFGFVSPRPMTERQVNKWLIEHCTKGLDES